MKRFISACFSIAALIGAFALLLAIQGQQQRNALIADVIIASETHAAAQRAARAELWTSFVAGLYDVLLIIAWFAAALLLLGIATWIYQRIIDARLTMLTPTASGLYPLQIIRGQLINPNLMIYAALGDNGPANVPPAAALGASTSADRILVAANMRQLHLNAAGAKLLAGRYDPPPPQIAAAVGAIPDRTSDPTPTPSAAPLALTDAWQRSTADRWLLGQSEDGATYNLNLDSSVHVGLLGATGTGKTSSTALLIALAARRWGYHVIVLDGKGGIDWQRYNATLEVWPADYTTIGDQLSTVQRIHGERLFAMQTEGADNFRNMAVLRYAPILVVVEEYGYISQALRSADSSAAEKIASLHSNLMRVSRATGVHFLLIDQSPQHWPGVIRANVKTWISYRLGGGQAAAINMYATHKLPPAGAFMASDAGETIYKSWHTAAAAQPLLRQLPPASQRIIDGQYTVREPVRNAFADLVRDPFAVRSPEVDPPPPPTNAANERTPSPPTTEDGWYEWTLAEYLPAHPELLQLDPQGRGVGIKTLAITMATHSRRDASQYEAFKGIASTVAARIRASAYIAGSHLGADKTVTYQEQQ